jgi:hypothetical protein
MVHRGDTRQHQYTRISQRTNRHTLVMEPAHTHLQQHTDHQTHKGSYMNGLQDIHITDRYILTMCSILRSIRHRIRRRQLYLFSIHLEGRGTHRHHIQRCGDRYMLHK